MFYKKTSTVFAEGIYLTYFLACNGENKINNFINIENKRIISYENFKESFYINGYFSINNPQGYLSADELFTIDVRK